MSPEERMTKFVPQGTKQEAKDAGYKPALEKFRDYESLKEQAHRKVDSLTRQQLRKFLKRNGREFGTTNSCGTQLEETQKHEHQKI